MVSSSGSTTVLNARRRDPAGADVAQLVEHHLAKVRVAGSNPVVRSEAPDAVYAAEGLHGSREPFLSWRRGRKRRSGRVA